MCLLVTLAPGTKWRENEHAEAAKSNPDGCGVAWVHGGQLRVRRSLNRIDLVYDMLRAHVDSPRVLHYRLATSGLASDLHPFRIAGKYVLAHNGVLSAFMDCTDDTRSRSDTKRLAQALYGLVRDGVDLHEGSSVWNLLDVGGHVYGNKFAVMDRAGRISRIGAGWHRVRDGIMATNRSYQGTLAKHRNKRLYVPSHYILSDGQVVCAACLKHGERGQRITGVDVCDRCFGIPTMTDWPTRLTGKGASCMSR